MTGRTTCSSSPHRLSTVQNADAIMVLDHGRIIERGTHDHLIKPSTAPTTSCTPARWNWTKRPKRPRSPGERSTQKARQPCRPEGFSGKGRAAFLRMRSCRGRPRPGLRRCGPGYAGPPSAVLCHQHGGALAGAAAVGQHGAVGAGQWQSTAPHPGRRRPRRGCGPCPGGKRAGPGGPVYRRPCRGGVLHRKAPAAGGGGKAQRHLPAGGHRLLRHCRTG